MENRLNTRSLETDLGREACTTVPHFPKQDTGCQHCYPRILRCNQKFLTPILSIWQVCTHIYFNVKQTLRTIIITLNIYGEYGLHHSLPLISPGGSERLTNLFKFAQIVSSEPGFKFSFISEPLYIRNPRHTVPPANTWMCHVFSYIFFYLIRMAS